ncbi:MAG: hypothetical protein U0903_15980 [Planctomycetales bacterium]
MHIKTTTLDKELGFLSRLLVDYYYARRAHRIIDVIEKGIDPHVEKWKNSRP